MSDSGNYEVEPQAPKSVEDENPYQAGRTFRNTATGDLGIFKGQEMRGDKTYYKFGVGDVETLIPSTLAPQRFEALTEEQLAQAQEELKHREPEIVKKIKAGIQEHATYTVDTLDFPNLTVEDQQKLERLLTIAKDSSAVFRGDSRHPYAKSKLDMEYENKEGPFENGFPNDLGKAVIADDDNPEVHTSPSLDTSLEYPKLPGDDDYTTTGEMPGTWDGTSYLYIIDPTALYKQPEKLEYHTAPITEILSGSIPESSIIAAIEYNKRTAQFMGIHENPNYNAPTEDEQNSPQ